MEENNYSNQVFQRVALLVLADALSLFLSYFFAFWLVFSYRLPFNLIQSYQVLLAVAILLKLVVFSVTRMYRTLWRYASIEELWQIVASVTAANFIAIIFFIICQASIPTTVLVLAAIFDLVFIGGIRILYRTGRVLKNSSGQEKKPVLIVGAGEAGIKMLKEVSANKQGMCVVGFIDDDPNKQRRMLNGIKVLGGRNSISEIVADNDIYEIIIAMPTANKVDRTAIASICHDTGIPVKILPTIEDILNYDADTLKVRDLSIEDLLDREEVVLDKASIRDTISGKRVLVTGGAGSIGSELCRQIIRFHPSELMILDFNENSLYFLELELKRYIREHMEPEGHSVRLVTRIASIRERDVIDRFFATHHPEIVFHAAAHKHVPLMERTPREAVKNNVFGTLNILDACIAHKVSKFVQISTDKAVNPTNVMGATKRVCEMLTQIYDTKNDVTDCVAVRFGNVLGSNGSVIPIFKEQIANGGPVTVTDKEITRFFMTIPEATQLVLQAASMAKGGEIFVLDMGEPERITDLAEKMIRLSGFEPYTEIPISFIGLRPGEKLYEELSYNLDTFEKTASDSIYVEKPVVYDVNAVTGELDDLWEKANQQVDEDITDAAVDADVVAGIKTLVPEFTETGAAM